MKNTMVYIITAGLVLLCIGCHHHAAVGNSGAPYANGYTRKGMFVPYNAAALNSRIAVPWHRVTIAFPADESTLAQSCQYMGVLAAKSSKHAQVLTSRLGGTHLISAGSTSYVSSVSVIGAVGIPNYRTSFTYHVFRCAQYSKIDQKLPDETALVNHFIGR